jgi:gliding motility-associated-like protein
MYFTAVMRKAIFYCIFFIVCIGIYNEGFAQNKSNKGKEFWLGYGHNIIMTPGGFNDVVNSQEQTIYISTDAPANVTVSINGTSWVQNIVLPANSINASILIPKTGVNDARLLTEGLSTKGIHIVSDTPIVVYAHQYATQSSAATMLMPVETWGYNYASLNFYQVSNYANSFSWFYVVATEDNTRLNIKPADTTQGGWLPTQTYTVNLNKGEIYNVFGKQVSTFNGKDMTGSKVTSVQGADGKCHPIAMFCGSSRNILLSPNCTFTYLSASGVNVVNGHGGELLFQQMFPTNAWGTRYLTYHCVNNTSNDLLTPYKNLYRVVVKDPSTIVKRNGVVLTGLVNNFFYEFSSFSGDYIEANKPILMAQYLVNSNQCAVPVPPPSPLPANGDPEMLYLSPIEQGVKSTLFFAARRTNGIGIVYVNVIVPTNGLASMLIDGTAVDTWEHIPHPNYPNYSVVARRFSDPEGKHTISCDSSFTAINYGLGDYESYGYNAGCLVNNLDGYGGIKNTYNINGEIDTFSCPKTPIKLMVKLAYPATSIIWKLSQVNGILPNVDVVDNAPISSGTQQINGRTYYLYTLPQDYTFSTTGTFYIPITYIALGIDACNSSDNFTFPIKIKQGPIANFTIPNACQNETITLTGNSQANGFTIASYLWNFTDATTQNTANAIKSFAAIGNYNVRYRIFTNNGCVGDTSKNVTIGSPTNLTFQTLGKPCIDSFFTFTSSIQPNSINPPTWYWNFGDGTSSFISNSNIVTHAYTTIPTDSIKHAVSFSVGCGTDTSKLKLPIIHSNPTASFTTKKDTLCTNKPILFTSNLINVNKWMWNFGNGISNETPPFYHSYFTNNNFSITLKIVDNNGCGSNEASDFLLINPSPIVKAGSSKFIQKGESVLLNASVSPLSIFYEYIWNPNLNLNFSNILQPIASPTNNTLYSLTATNPITFCSSKDSVLVSIITKLFIPNSFTPNGDNNNDYWKMNALQQYPNAVVSIFNRYGELIYQTNNYFLNPWNGRFKGILQEMGTYAFKIQLFDTKQKDIVGTVNIIR